MSRLIRELRAKRPSLTDAGFALLGSVNGFIWNKLIPYIPAMPFTTHSDYETRVPGLIILYGLIAMPAVMYGIARVPLLLEDIRRDRPVDELY